MSVLLLLCAALAAENGPSVPGRQIVGLLELPRVFGQGAAIPARAKHDRRSRVVARLSRAGDVVSSEHAYEARAAVVVGTDAGWYEVALSSKGSAWVDAADAGKFHPLEELLESGLSYMTEAWDARLYETPDGPARSVPAHLRQAKVKGSVRKLGRLWLRVELRMFSDCEGKDEAPADAGWVPAHRADGVPNAWYYSRGC